MQEEGADREVVAVLKVGAVEVVLSPMVEGVWGQVEVEEGVFTLALGMQTVVVALQLSNLEVFEDMPPGPILEEQEERDVVEAHPSMPVAGFSAVLLSETAMVEVPIGQVTGMTVCLLLVLLSAIKMPLPAPAS